MLSIGLECFLEGWDAFDRVGIPLYRAGIPLYRVEVLSKCFLQCWNTFDRVGIPLYRVGMNST
jgi:hypothetical protein